MSDRQLFLLLDQPFALNIVLSLAAVVVLAEIGLLVAQNSMCSLSVARALQASAAGTLSLLFSATFCSLAMYDENTFQQLPFLSSLAIQLLASATVCSWGQGALLRSAVRHGHRQRVMQVFASSSSLFSGGALLAYVTADLHSSDGPPHIGLSTWRVWGYMVAVMGAVLSSWLLHSRRAVLPLGPVRSWSTLSICQAITFVSSSWFLVRLFMNEHDSLCVDQRTGHCSTPIDETFLLVVGCIPFYLLPKILFELTRSRKPLENIQSTAEAVKQEFFVHKMDDVLEEQRLKALPEAVWPKQVHSTLHSNGRQAYAGGALHGDEKSPAECVPSQRHNRHLRQPQTRALGMNTQAQDNQLWA
ncbi:hypothetical protein AB1Y20_021243 [Prymnesium parvum]|uniref:Uncharacterized protein n=1 Tax=Prymnesium parvum TaxID=97485 RepID=A0AB34JJ52_PRYPA